MKMYTKVYFFLGHSVVTWLATFWKFKLVTLLVTKKKSLVTLLAAFDWDCCTIWSIQYSYTVPSLQNSDVMKMHVKLNLTICAVVALE